MCGRYTVAVVTEEVKKELNVQFELPWTPIYNATPSSLLKPHPLPVITSENRHEIIPLVWGLIPFFSKEPMVKYSTINARIEKIVQSPVYRKPIRSQRCLVLANSYFEWHKIDAKTKIPHVVYHRDQPLFAFAGIWDQWTDKQTGEVHKSFSIITAPAPEHLAHLHHRTAVVLPPHVYERWLDDIPLSEVTEILEERTNDRLNAYPISTAVNSPANNDQSILKPIGEPIVPETEFRFQHYLKLEGMGASKENRKHNDRGFQMKFEF